MYARLPDGLTAAILFVVTLAASSAAKAEENIMCSDQVKPVPRIELPLPCDMSPEQRAVYDQAVNFFGAPIGPRIALMITPEVATRWSDLLTALEKSTLSRRLWELTILFVAREWDSQFEWWAHEAPALRQGLSHEVVEALRRGERPAFENADEAAVYQYLTELMHDHRVTDPTYDALKAHIGSRQVVELTVLAGHYANVAMTLAAHDVQLPPDVDPPLPSRQ
ncbi:carboxymuconolactone decarboxylase family protein [Novosphingobium sp. AAP83]|uniref:carboxymuconolactone decarboxylase family protein n=1 Tax=Novosphingobium sp. AAP83 TaxID=1523425 RepID=UPI0006B92871|nr:hypothetical protein [Novosphingobium sp. AAP83]